MKCTTVQSLQTQKLLHDELCFWQWKDQNKELSKWQAREVVNKSDLLEANMQWIIEQPLSCLLIENFQPTNNQAIHHTSTFLIHKLDINCSLLTASIAHQSNINLVQPTQAWQLVDIFTTAKLWSLKWWVMAKERSPKYIESPKNPLYTSQQIEYHFGNSTPSHRKISQH